MKVLLPIDGSIYSDRAVEYICEHSSLRAKTDTVYLLNVQKKLPSEFASKIPNSEEILDEAAKKILKPAKKALEAAGYKVKLMIRRAGGEDFSFMLQAKPGCLFRLGVQDETHNASVHNPEFDFNDKAIATGAACLLTIALNRAAS